jgi:P-type Cu+ transporter
LKSWPRTGPSTWLELILATPVVLWAGLGLLRPGRAIGVNKSLNMFTLIGLGVSVAYVYSVIGALLPGNFPRRPCAARTVPWGSISRRRR